MQFVKQGPDIPERLLQAHEEGRVVFFCGAGVSYPARLPGFDSLVKRIYDELSVTPDATQSAAIKAKQYDTAIGLLEASVFGKRQMVRTALARILTPDYSAPNATATHKALIELARVRVPHGTHPVFRLITTNFDRIFEKVLTDEKLDVARFSAPLLPVPKTRWNGLVYLHGLLDALPSPADLDQLVVSSGDFGLAYLTERWAARFVTDLFRSYVVCFVGYSINDPVLRYMMDALAADKLLGESTPEVFAFGSYSKAKKAAREAEWRAKNVTPILYREHNRHALLHRTLRLWSETYRDGSRGKERIVVELAGLRPTVSTSEDDFVGRVLWALSDKEALPAKRFAELHPAPLLDWIEPLSEGRFSSDDLVRFGVTPGGSADPTLSFSFTRRPTPYELAPRMAIAVRSASTRWDERMHQVARWLLRHLNNPKLLVWLAAEGGQLHDQFSQIVEQRLGEIANLERSGDRADVQRLRDGAPDAVPTSAMRALWSLLLAGRIRGRAPNHDVYAWRRRFARDGLTVALRLELRAMLSPVIVVTERSDPNVAEAVSPSPSELVNCDVVLAADYADVLVADFKGEPTWAPSLLILHDDFATQLRDTLDLLRELGKADDRSDLSYVYRPSIADHGQNRDQNDWTALVSLVRDAWLEIARQDEGRALEIASSWLRTPYPIFKRLAFFAAATNGRIGSSHGAEWLLTDGAWWFWSVESEREALRLLVAVSPTLSNDDVRIIEAAVFAGPPLTMFSDDVDPDRLRRAVDREIWLRLAKMRSAAAPLTAAAVQRLDGLERDHPDWQVQADARDEFPFWMGTPEGLERVLATPRTRRDLVLWLREHPKEGIWTRDDWHQRCREDFPTTASSLLQLSKQDYWPIERWRTALQTWSEDRLQRISWRHFHAVLRDAPLQVIQELDNQLSWWLQAIAKVFNGHEGDFLALCDRLLDVPYESEDSEDRVFRAINHPVGHVTQALVSYWHRTPLKDEQGIPPGVRERLSAICARKGAAFRHGILVLGMHLVTLFRVDRAWTERYLLPYFRWSQHPAEAVFAWDGFLSSPRIYMRLLEAVKSEFLAVPHHYVELGHHRRQYAAMLALVALEPDHAFSVSELRNATSELPAEGLRECLQTVVQALEASATQRDEYWTNRVAPYLRNVWPKTIDTTSTGLAERLARLCVAAGSHFEEALSLMGAALRPVPHPDYVVDLLAKAGLPRAFPEASLVFLDKLVGDGGFPPSALRECLEAICQAAPSFLEDARYQRLDDYLRRHGL